MSSIPCQVAEQVRLHHSELHDVAAGAQLKILKSMILSSNRKLSGESATSVSNRSSAVLSVLVHAYARAGRRAEALRVLDELRRRRKTGYVAPAAFLNVYLGLGDTELAFLSMGRAAGERSNIMISQSASLL